MTAQSRAFEVQDQFVQRPFARPIPSPFISSRKPGSVSAGASAAWPSSRPR